MSSRLTSAARAIAFPGLAVVAMAGCGSAIHSIPGSNVPAASSKPLGNGVVDQQAEPYFKCLRAAGLPVVRVAPMTLQVGALPVGPTIHFAPDPPVAEGDQINGTAAGAEAIGAALLYVHTAPDAELATIEGCLDQSVKG